MLHNDLPSSDVTLALFGANGLVVIECEKGVAIQSRFNSAPLPGRNEGARQNTNVRHGMANKEPMQRTLNTLSMRKDAHMQRFFP